MRYQNHQYPTVLFKQTLLWWLAHTTVAGLMSRKGVGLAAFDRSRLTSAQYASHGSNLRTSHATSLSTQLSVFRSLLQQFAQTHAKDIRSNPSFRAEFARMCAVIGVDPLASSSGAGGKEGGGSLWSQLLGGSVNDFYFELAVRVVEVCGETREENGGLIGVKEVRERIMRTRMEGGVEITEYVSSSVSCRDKRQAYQTWVTNNWN